MDKKTILEEKRKKGMQSWLGATKNDRNKVVGVADREGEVATVISQMAPLSQITSMSESDLHLLTGKITASIREEMKREAGLVSNSDIRRALSDKMDRYLESELHTHTCKLCSALMVSPNHTPILLFPCGHRWGLRWIYFDVKFY